MQKLQLGFADFVATQNAQKTYCVTSTQFLDVDGTGEKNTSVVDLHAVKVLGGDVFLYTSTVLEADLGDYVIVNNREMSDTAINDAIALALANAS